MGRVAWNKGLTKETDVRVLANSLATSKTNLKKGIPQDKQLELQNALEEKRKDKSWWEKINLKRSESSKKAWKNLSPEEYEERRKVVRLENNPMWIYGKWEGTIVKMAHKEILKTREWKCEHCNKLEEKNGKSLSIHHKDKNRKNNKGVNLMVLCNSCHWTLHHKQGDFNG